MPKNKIIAEIKRSQSSASRGELHIKYGNLCFIIPVPSDVFYKYERTTHDLTDDFQKINRDVLLDFISCSENCKLVKLKKINSRFFLEAEDCGLEKLIKIPSKYILWDKYIIIEQYENCIYELFLKLVHPDIQPFTIQGPLVGDARYYELMDFEEVEADITEKELLEKLGFSI